MELTPALKEKVEKAIQAALKDVKPRPAVDRLLTARVTGKWAHYCQYLTEYKPGEFGVIYVGLPELKVTVHEPGSRSAKIAARKETIRRRKQETTLAKEKANAERKVKS
ncbi:MAG: hypothetical protein WCC98_16750 [Candidatus Acidiferrales bacterium]